LNTSHQILMLAFPVKALSAKRTIILPNQINL